MLSDAQWSELEALVEACRPKAKTSPKDLQRTLSAILWRHQNGAKWLAIPENLGPSALYRIEAEIRGRSAEERQAARQERSRPVVDALEAWLRKRLGLLSRKSNLAEAIRYALSRCEGLSLFLDDGRVETDSNTVEWAIRPLALNRKNASRRRRSPSRRMRRRSTTRPAASSPTRLQLFLPRSLSDGGW